MVSITYLESKLLNQYIESEVILFESVYKTNAWFFL